ncbi:hypothetical protein [uncultured Sneathiella sp.]|jgi:hypothetical protein
MKYLIMLGIVFLAAGCANFSIDNPNPYSVYNYDYPDCCQQDSRQRP